MSKPMAANYWEYTIHDVDSYREAFSGADLELTQLEPGRLSGRHVRLGLPGGQFSVVETSAQMRGNGTLPNVWTLSVILGSATRSRQYGIEVHAGSLVLHRPGGLHDGVYGRNFKAACISIHDKVFAKQFPLFHPQLQAAMHRPWSVFEPQGPSRQKIIEHFAEAAAIIQSDPKVRNSPNAVAKLEEELVGEFVENMEQELPMHSDGAEQRAAAMVRQIDQYAHKIPQVSSSVPELCAACDVPRRTLDRAFQQAVGMGPAAYVRRIRLNAVRRALQRQSAGSTTVTDVALKFGFWHLGRFAEQYYGLFGESPHVSLCSTSRKLRQPERGTSVTRRSLPTL
jgi:AraC-like DNA-binding protein